MINYSPDVKNCDKALVSTGFNRFLGIRQLLGITHVLRYMYN